MVKIKCLVCNKEKEVKESDIKRGWGKCCSKSCAATLRARKPNSNYKRYRQRLEHRKRLGIYSVEVDPYTGEKTYYNEFDEPIFFDGHKFDNAE